MLSESPILPNVSLKPPDPPNTISITNEPPKEKLSTTMVNVERPSELSPTAPQLEQTKDKTPPSHLPPTPTQNTTNNFSLRIPKPLPKLKHNHHPLSSPLL